MSETKINIVFRACDAMNSVNKNPRPFGLDKPTLIKICFLSLYHSARSIPHSFTIVGDKLSDDMMNFFSGFEVSLSNGVYGNDESIRQTFRIAEAFADDEWVYFCEDDYLHTHSAMTYIHNFISRSSDFFPREARLYNLASFFNLAKRDMVIYPPDYPDRYKGKYRRFSLIIHSDDCHWRQVTDTTFTMLMKVRTFRKHIVLMRQCANGANDRMLSRRLYGRFSFSGKTLCLSPLPGLSTHMHVDTLTPLVNWQLLVDEYMTMIQ